MSDIRLLDCTLRDGGYVNDWKFGHDSLVGIFERLVDANVDIIGEKEITEALNKKFGDVILTDEYKVTNIWMEYFPLLQNDSFTDIKLIPVWCLDFEVNGNGAEDGGYTIRINAITGDEIA